MEINKFIEKLELALSEPTHYETGGWGKWNGKSWGFDCNNLGKGILWGWNNDKSKPRGGGAVYASNGMPDVGETTMFNMCKNISTDFSNIKKGEFVWMTGHIGYYIGNGYVIEATKNSKFKADGVIKSKIGSKGERLYNNTQSGSWLKHGFFPLIEYENSNKYVVQGDTIEDIAKKYDVTPEELIKENNITDNRIYVGQELTIPQRQEKYTLGNYICNYNVNVREGAGTNYAIKKVKDLTEDGKKNATSTNPEANAVYKKGTIFTALEIIKNSDTEYWAKSPSGTLSIEKNGYKNCSKN